MARISSYKSLLIGEKAHFKSTKKLPHILTFSSCFFRLKRNNVRSTADLRILRAVRGSGQAVY